MRLGRLGGRFPQGATDVMQDLVDSRLTADCQSRIDPARVAPSFGRLELAMSGPADDRGQIGLNCCVVSGRGQVEMH